LTVFLIASGKHRGGWNHYFSPSSCIYLGVILRRTHETPKKPPNDVHS